MKKILRVTLVLRKIVSGWVRLAKKSSGWVKFWVGSWPIPSLQDYSYPFEDIIFRFRASLVQEGVQRTIQSRKLVKKFNDDNGEVLLGNTLVLIFFDSGSTKVLLCQ